MFLAATVNIVILQFSRGNIAKFQLHKVIFAIPLHKKVSCEWVKI